MERIAPFVLARPATLAEAVALLAATPGARPLAGGTDLLPNLRDGIGESPVLVDLGGIAGFSAITVERDRTTIGAGVTLARIASDATIAGALPALAEAAAVVAGPGHRTVATLGGNLCLDTRCVFYNQSEWWRRANDFCLKHGGDVCHVAPQGKHCHAAFSGDLAPVLLVQGATVEIVAAVRIAAQPASARTAYRKARARGAIDFPLAGVAARVAMNDGRIGALRVALTGTNARPFVLDGTNALIGAAVTDETLTQLGKLVQKQVSPMRTTVTHSYYRRQVAAVLVQRLVRELAAEPVAGVHGTSG
jgi:4-hydroxybenzoyl-CoA reductase subunit beta